MKRKVVYVQALSPIMVGAQAIVIPLNHTSDLVLNGHECLTSIVVLKHEDGTTFETLNSLYVLAASPAAQNIEQPTAMEA